MQGFNILNPCIMFHFYYAHTLPVLHLSLSYTAPCLTPLTVLHLSLSYTSPCLTPLPVLHLSLSYTSPCLTPLTVLHLSPHQYPLLIPLSTAGTPFFIHSGIGAPLR